MVTVERVDDENTWNEYVNQAIGGSVFHQSAFLEAAAEKSDSDLFLLVGKKGTQPVGIFPVFEVRVGPVTAAVSPPPKTGIPYLGPAFIRDPNIKYRKRSLTEHEFLENCLEWIRTERSPRFIRVLSNPWCDDIRPFQWDGFDVSPQYTHTLDLDRSESELLASFSRDARTAIQDEYDVEYTIRTGNESEIEYLVSRLEERYETQSETFSLSRAYLNQLYETLPDETIIVYVLEVEGQPITGRISLVDDGMLWFWQGVPKPSESVDMPANDLLNWHSLRDAKARDCTKADLSGANTERLWTYKGKFNPILTPYHEITSSSPGYTLGSRLYSLL